MQTTSSRTRTQVRSIFGLATSTNVRVKIIPGGAIEPKLLGRRGGHFTRGGARIHHPSAYAKCGWSNMVYRCSTLRICVGEKWLTQKS